MEVVLDVDATDDVLHGGQEGRFFHGYYKNYCYLPLYLFCGEHLLCARLRTADHDGAHGVVEELEGVVSRIRAQWPGVRVVVRGDSGCCRDEWMKWCEEEGVEYVLGLAKNARLKRMVAEEAEQARRLHEASGEAERVFKELRYRTVKSWSCERRVVGKVEHLSGGENPRFIVKSIPVERWERRGLYGQGYCARGEMENRIKEQQLDLFADRTSSHRMQANQVRSRARQSSRISSSTRPPARRPRRPCPAAVRLAMMSFQNAFRSLMEGRPCRPCRAGRAGRGGRPCRTGRPCRVCRADHACRAAAWESTRPDLTGAQRSRSSAGPDRLKSLDISGLGDLIAPPLGGSCHVDASESDRTLLPA